MKRCLRSRSRVSMISLVEKGLAMQEIGRAAYKLGKGLPTKDVRQTLLLDKLSVGNQDQTEMPNTSMIRLPSV
jgi:hypothetical protein